MVVDVILKDVNISISEYLQALADDLASILERNNIVDIRRRAHLTVYNL